MAVITLNKKELKKLLGSISDEKIDNSLNMFGVGVERISTESVEVEVTPNRPDMLSQSGIFRALSYYLGKKKKEYKIHKPEKNYLVKINKNLKDIRPYTACAIVKNLRFNDERIKEIIDIQEKLHSTLGRNRKKVAIGIYPLEAITLPIKFEARKPEDIKFIPLDSEMEMTGREILQKHPTGRDYGKLLEGKEKFPIFVDAKGEILSMPPIINSEKTGKITEKTSSVFIECSGFDFNMLKKTLNILVTVMADMQGEVYQMTLDYGKKEITPDLTPEKMKISIENINKLLGLDLKEAEIKKLLEKMGYNYNLNRKEVEVPAYRADIMHEVDIAEDVAIAYGYDKMIPEIPQIASIGQEDEKEKIKRKIAEILTGLGLLEISSLHLLTKEDLEKAKIKEAIEVEESKSDYKFLRPNILVSAIKVLSENIDAEYPQKIFEIGTVFEKDEKEETGIREKDKLVIALTPNNFTELKQILEYLARMLEVEFKTSKSKDFDSSQKSKIFDIEETEKEGFIEGRVGKIIFNKKEIGIIGEIHPSLLKKWHLKMPLVCLELDLEEILSLR